MKSSLSNALGHVVSWHTVTWWIWAHRICVYRSYRGTVLTHEHCVCRLQWPERYFDSNFSKGRRWCLQIIVYSVFRSMGRVQVYRCQGERMAWAYVQEFEPFGRGSVMLWVGICDDGKTKVLIINVNLTGVRYYDVILGSVVFPLHQQP